MSFAGQLTTRIPRFDLPMLTHEMRIRMRGGRPFAVMFVYVLVLSAIALAVVYSAADLQGAPRQIAVHQYTSGPAALTGMLAMYGRRLFVSLSLAQLAMIALIVPAYGAGTVTAERERGTLALLSLTLLSSSTIIVQKLAAALAQAVMLLIASGPVLGIVFLLGGVSPPEVFVVYCILLSTAAMVGALGVMCSCLLRNTRSSTFMAYLVTLVFLIGMPIGGVWFKNVASMGLYESATSFPLTFTAMFAFSGGVAALVIYGALALLLRKVSQHWRTRAFRMAVFGAVYALLLLALSVPSTTDMLINTLYRRDVFLPLFVNPLYAISVLTIGGIASPLASGGYGCGPMEALVVGATILFAIGCAYPFKQISAARFESLRRT